MKYFLPIFALCLVGCVTSKAPVTPIKVGITHLQTVNESVYSTLDDQKSNIVKLNITTNGAQLTTKDIKTLLDTIKALQPKQ